MTTTITPALALLIAVLATIPASAGPRDGAPTAVGNEAAFESVASGGGNLVPLW